MESKGSENGSDVSPNVVESRRSSPRKRKRSRSQESSSTYEARRGSVMQMKTPKRLRGRYNDEYRQLLNAVIADATQDSHINHEPTTGDEDEDEEDRLEVSQIGLSVWSSEQKEAFFHALARYGRDDLPRLASVTQKSEPEVHEYLQLLHSGMLELASKRERGIRTLAGHLSAAAEISNKCCDALELTGDALAWLQNTWDIKQEQEKHGDLWLLDRTVADRIDRVFITDRASGQSSTSETDTEDESMSSNFLYQKANDASGDPTLLEALPAVKLLDLSKFINLSEHIFMNSLKPEGNWRTYEDNFPVKPLNTKSRPTAPVSIFNTAFSDIHHVLVNLTKRLVHVALFQATTRLRATDYLKRQATHHPLVRRRDVMAALKIVGLKPNSFDYWASLPKRHRLKWFYQKHHGVSRKIDISSEEAGKYLEMPPNKSWPGIPDDMLGMTISATAGIADGQGEVELRPENGGKYEKHDLGAEMEDTSSVGEEENPESDGLEDLDSGDETSEAEEFKQAHVKVLQLERANDGYLELLDTNNSREQEVRLWELLQLVEPESVDLQPVRLPDQPKRAPLLGYGTPYHEWRDWTRVHAEWEGSGTASDEDGGSLAVGEEGSETNSLEPAEEPHVLDEFSSDCSSRTEGTLSD
jgi:RNA polymerase I-specific transcription initiation factor RRN5